MSPVSTVETKRPVAVMSENLKTDLTGTPESGLVENATRKSMPDTRKLTHDSTQAKPSTKLTTEQLDQIEGLANDAHKSQRNRVRRGKIVPSSKNAPTPRS